MTEPITKANLKLLPPDVREVVEYFSQNQSTQLNGDITVVAKAVTGVRLITTALIASQKRARKLEGLLSWFISRVDAGQIRSTRTYRVFKQALNHD